MAINILIQIAIALAMLVLSYVLMPKPKQPKPKATTDFEAPTSDAGRPIPVVFGSITIKGPNVLAYTDKNFVDDSQRDNAPVFDHVPTQEEIPGSDNGGPD